MTTPQEPTDTVACSAAAQVFTIYCPGRGDIEDDANDVIFPGEVISGRCQGPKPGSRHSALGYVAPAVCEHTVITLTSGAA